MIISKLQFFCFLYILLKFGDLIPVKIIAAPGMASKNPLVFTKAPIIVPKPTVVAPVKIKKPLVRAVVNNGLRFIPSISDKGINWLFIRIELVFKRLLLFL